MDKIQIESDFTLKQLTGIAYQLKSDHKIGLSNTELERMVEEALPYVKEAIKRR